MLSLLYFLRFTWLCCLLSAVPFSLFSQNNTPAPALEILLSFQAEPAAPVVVADSSSGRSFVFFHPAKAPFADEYPCQAFELAMKPPYVQHPGPVGKIRLAWGWKSDPKPLASCQDKEAVYIWLLDHLQLLAVRIDKTDLTVKSTPTLRLEHRNDILGVTMRGDHALLLLKEKRRRDKSVIKIIRLQAGAPGPAQEVAATHLYGLFSKDFRPPQTATGINCDPAQAASPFRLFDLGNDTIWITHDGRFGPSGLETAALRLYTVDLKRGTSNLEELPYLPSGPQTGIAARGASYIAQGKLFQVYVTHAQWNLLVRDLATRSVLHHEHITLRDSLPAFNAPVRISKNFLQGKSSNPVEELLNAYMETLPYLLVEPSQEGYRLHSGGSSVASGELWLAPFIQPSAAVGILVRRWSQQRSFSLYRLLDKGSLDTHPEPVLEKTFFQACENLSDALNEQAKRAAEAVYRFGAKSYLGVYTVKTAQYGFYRLEDW